jgi:hypothetical protein
MAVSGDIYRRHMHRLPTPLCDWTSDGRCFQATNICRNVTHHTRPQSSGTPLSEHQTCVFCEVRTQLVHFTETDIASEGVKRDRLSDACSAQAYTSFRDCTCLTRVGVVDSLRAAHSDCLQRAISDGSHSTAGRSTAMLQNTHSSASVRRQPTASFAILHGRKHVIPTVVIRGYPQSHPSAGTVPQTGSPRPSIRSPPHSTPHSVGYSTVLLKAENTWLWCLDVHTVKKCAAVDVSAGHAASVIRAAMYRPI